MSSQVFYRKWRPQTLEEVVGQEHVTRTLKRALETGRISHAYLFCGPRGTGKTSTGRILAKAVNCLSSGKGEPCNTCAVCREVTEGKSLDVIEIDAASNRGIDDIRTLREKVGFSPSRARYKVYIVDEVHQLTGPAFGALLKTLEEPPPHIIFILATTEPHMVPGTILSRCQRFDFRRLNQAAVQSRLGYICQQEGVEIDAESLKLINRAATGSLRDAENILEQMVASFGHKIELVQVRQTLGLSSEGRVKELTGHIMARNIPAGLANINQAAGDGLDLRQYNRELVNYLRSLLFIKGGARESLEMTGDEVQEIQNMVAGVPLGHILRAAQTFGAIDMRLDSYSPLPLELALLECSLDEAVPPARPPAERQPAPVRKPVKAETPRPVRPAAPGAPVSAAPSPAMHQVSPPDMEPPPAGSPTEAAVQPPSTLEELKAQWKSIQSSVSTRMKKINTEAAALLLSNCKVAAVDGDTVTFAFKSALLKQRFDKDPVRQAVEKVLGELINRPCKAQSIVQTDKDHPMVKALMDMGIGAKIVNDTENQ